MMTRNAYCAIGLFLAVAFAHLTANAADTYPRQPGIRILRYTFDVTLGDASDELVIKDTVDLQFVASGVTGVNLDLCNLIKQPQPADRLNPCLVPPPRAAR